MHWTYANSNSANSRSKILMFSLMDSVYSGWGERHCSRRRPRTYKKRNKIIRT